MRWEFISIWYRSAFCNRKQASLFWPCPSCYEVSCEHGHPWKIFSQLKQMMQLQNVAESWVQWRELVCQGLGDWQTSTNSWKFSKSRDEKSDFFLHFFMFSTTYINKKWFLEKNIFGGRFQAFLAFPAPEKGRYRRFWQVSGASRQKQISGCRKPNPVIYLGATY